MKVNNNVMLSREIISLYNYSKTKDNVDKIMHGYEIYTYKYSEILPPKITSSYEVKYEMFTLNKTDKVGNYVMKKLDKLQEISEFYSRLCTFYEKLTNDELVYFSNSYLNKLSESIICEKLSIGSSTLSRIKTSAIIKAGLYFGVDVEI